MRPGSALVVMALAFILGARRSTSQQSSPQNDRKSDLPNTERTGFLANLNPWLSACDIANPQTATDLQVIYECLKQLWYRLKPPFPPPSPNTCVICIRPQFVIVHSVQMYNVSNVRGWMCVRAESEKNRRRLKRIIGRIYHHRKCHSYYMV